MNCRQGRKREEDRRWENNELEAREEKGRGYKEKKRMNLRLWRRREVGKRINCRQSRKGKRKRRGKRMNWRQERRREEEIKGKENELYVMEEKGSGKQNKS